MALSLSDLKEEDREVFEAIRDELHRQRNVIELIASENIASPAVLEAMGSWLTNKYSEGYPGKRHYGGNEFIDRTENLAIERAKRLFGAEHANVQCHSGSQANFAAYAAVLGKGDRILSMDLSHGGHLSHGSRASFSGKLYTPSFYGVNKETEMLDMDEIKKIALEAKPKLIVAGASAYPRKIDFKAFREIADETDAYLMVDMAHIAGLIAAKLHPDPVPYSDIITTTTHKTLRGPRGGMILCMKEDRLKEKYSPDSKKNLAQKIDSAVFPGNQGGPLDHVIAAKAVAFGEALKKDFIGYQKQIIKNAKALALLDRGFRLVSGGTDNHLMLVDLTNKKVSGKQAESALDNSGICCNKNLIPFDKSSPFDPKGIRLGTPLLTTRGMKEDEMRQIAGWIGKVIDNISDASLQKKVRSEAEQLCARFPIYPEVKL